MAKITDKQIKQRLDMAKNKVIVKCPECLTSCSKSELNMFGGLCEECSGVFDN